MLLGLHTVAFIGNRGCRARMSDFALEVAKYPKSSPNPKISQKGERAYCLAPYWHLGI